MFVGSVMSYIMFSSFVFLMYIIRLVSHSFFIVHGFNYSLLYSNSERFDSANAHSDRPICIIEEVDSVPTFFCSFVSMSLCVERLIHLRFVAILSFNSIQCNDFPNGIRMNRLTEWPKLDDTFEIIHIHKTYRNYADINSLKG